MIVLSQITDTIKVKLDTAHSTLPLHLYSSWRDISTSIYTPGRTVINSNGTTDVIAVGEPASGIQRVVDYISIINEDTISQNVTCKFDANGTQYNLWSGPLAPGETVGYVEGEGWRVLTAQGIPTSVQAANSPISSQFNVVVMGADVINNNATANTIADVTNLSFGIVAGETYWFRFIIPYTSAATATGSRWSINGPAAPTLLHYRSNYTLTSTSDTSNSATAYDTPAASNATSLTVGNVALIEGIIKPSSNGTLIARFASEVLSSAITAKAGATVQWMRLA